MAHGVALFLLLVAALPLGRGEDVKPKDPDQVSNDEPDRPLQMPIGSTETREAFEDFERFRKRGAWERALKALDGIAEDQVGRYVDGPDNFIIRIGQKRQQLLAALPPEGQAAYRLFHDADAKRLLETAEGPNEQKILEQVATSYFQTSSGDIAADRLGDLYYQAGRFDRAADCWLSILHDRPDSTLPPALVTVKAIAALLRAGRTSEAEPLEREVADRYARETLALGGQKATAAEHVAAIRKANATAAARGGPALSSDAGRLQDRELRLPEGTRANWQVRFADSITAAMSPQERLEWDQTAFSSAVPSVATANGKLFANYLGYVFAVDLRSGKMLWRSGAFHHAGEIARQNQGNYVNLDISRFDILTSDRFVWSLGRDISNPNSMPAYQLSCRRAETGDIAWQTSNLSEYAALDLTGVPIRVRDTLFIGARTPMNQGNQPQLFVLAIRSTDGKILWKSELGNLRMGQQYYYFAAVDTPRPEIVYRGGALYVETHQGLLARLDSDTGEVEWGHAYATDPAQSMGGRILIINGRFTQDTSATTSGPPLFLDGKLLIKGQKSDRLIAIDPDRRTRVWVRPIARSARLLGWEGGLILLGGPDMGAIDAATRALSWSITLPGGSEQARVLLQGDSIFQLTPRGIFEIDARNGSVRHIFRGDDTGSEGGNLIVSDDQLLAVSNRTISAYPLPERKGRAAALRTEDPDDRTTRQLHD